MDLTEDVKYIKGVGPNRVTLLNKIGIFNVKDLITYYPRGYEDRSKPKNICECVNGEVALIEAIAMSRLVDSRISKGRTMQRLLVMDETGQAVITWFNQPYLKSKFQKRKKIQILWKNRVSIWKNKHECTSV